MNKTVYAISFILLLVVLFFIFFGQNFAVVFVKSLSGEMLRPLETTLSFFRNNFMFWQDALFNIRNVKETNKNLVTENLELYGKLARLSQLEEENRLLREQLNLSRSGMTAKLAGIIGRDFQNNRSFVINKGSDDGIETGMTVVATGEVIVGKIIDVSYNTAKVQTILDTQSRIAAITSNSRVSGLIRGLGSDIIFDLIAKNKTPLEGELIISSGTEGVWPRGLAIGKVKKVKTGDNQVFNTAEIEMLLNLNEINDVFVITRNK